MKKIFLMAILVLAGSLAYTSAAQALTWSSNFVRHNDIVMTAATYEPSGLAWNPITNKLLAVCNTGQVTVMNPDGTGQDTKKMPSYMDFEAITFADANSTKVYIGDENPDSILEYDLQTKTLTGKSWNLTSIMTGADNQGLEGLTFVPNGYHPFPNSASGGVFYAGIQRVPVSGGAANDDYLLYAFDIDLNTSGKIVKWWGIPVAPNTPTGDISDLYFSKDTGVLYVLYDGANRLIEMRTDGVVIKDYSNVPVADQEGLVIKTNYPSLAADIYLGSDSQKLIGWYSGYPVNYDVDGDGAENSADCAVNDKTLSTKKIYYQDLDGDGLGSDVTTSLCSLTPPAGYVANSDDLDDNDYYNDNDKDDDGVAAGVDCNDNDKTVWALQTYYQDLDNDGKGSNASQQFCSSVPPANYVSSSANDCNDNDKTVFANQTYYKDADGDGLGFGLAQSFCLASAPSGYSPNAFDKNDDDFDNDGVSVADDCDDKDNAVLGKKTYYKDSDGDGLGFGAPLLSCLLTPPAGYVTNHDDLDDEHKINDYDGDGVITVNDCNDNDKTVWALQTYYQDFDNDGKGSNVSQQFCLSVLPANYVSSSANDCNDNDKTVWTLQTYYQDLDKDGLGSDVNKFVCSMAAPDNYVANSDDLNDSDFDNDGVATADDCNDADSNVGVRNIYYKDVDGDGLGSKVASRTNPLRSCSLFPPAGYVSNNLDLNDKDYDNDGVRTSRDCDDTNPFYFFRRYYYQDNDGDGLGNRRKRFYGCVPPRGYVTNDRDKNDNHYDSR